MLEGGEVGACVFEKPEPHVDDTLLYDYALFFVATLCDYYEATRDREALLDLWPVAWEQIQIGLRRLDERGIVKEDETWWCFIDWRPELNKQASAQAILLYCLKKGLKLAEAQALTDEMNFLREKIEYVTEAALQHLWDEERGWFISGPAAQVSWASQIWMTLAGVKDRRENGEILERLFDEPSAVRINTPYMYHHLIEALMESGKQDRAIEQMRIYWGGMIGDGADTFWEVYHPEDKAFSPYGKESHQQLLPCLELHAGLFYPKIFGLT
ncbi:hypothetical protein LJK87_13150 [Paenibacillus sp. P25]|nr:hypothetical protein LJK87_13150 [Paenibacillus sp. P25]